MLTINFFDYNNRQRTKREFFGLCDDDDKKPAYIDADLSNKDIKWIGIVENPEKKEVLFYPVDNCVDLKIDEVKMAKRCEGILCFENNNLIFTELKNWKITPNDWLTKGKEQIIETLSYFFKYYKSSNYKIKAWISNKSLTNQNYATQILQFRAETKEKLNLKIGLVLFVQKTIKI